MQVRIELTKEQQEAIRLQTGCRITRLRVYLNALGGAVGLAEMPEEISMPVDELLARSANH